MKHIRTINLENVSEEEVRKYSIRKAARAVVFDDDDLVALLHVTKNNYYKLPGGGIEKGEDSKEALKRECKEEIGCEVKIIKEVGSIVEHRKKHNLRQTSYCYIAEIIGKKGVPQLEGYEKDEGFQTVWLPFESAISKLKESKPVNYEGPYIDSRDLTFLEAAGKILNK